MESEYSLQNLKGKLVVRHAVVSRGAIGTAGSSGCKVVKNVGCAVNGNCSS